MYVYLSYFAGITDSLKRRKRSPSSSTQWDITKRRFHIQMLISLNRLKIMSLCQLRQQIIFQNSGIAGKSILVLNKRWKMLTLRCITNITSRVKLESLHQHNTVKTTLKMFACIQLVITHCRKRRQNSLASRIR